MGRDNAGVVYREWLRNQWFGVYYWHY